MKVDVSDILLINGASRKFSFVGEPPVRVPSDGCAIDGDISVTGTVTNNKGILHLDASLEAVCKSECYRCLKEVRSTLRLKIEEDFVNRADAEQTDMYPFEGKVLDIGKAVNDNIILNLPMKHLCSDQCKGLCSKCGVNLNEVQCDCVDDTIDPRLEGLNNFFKKS